MVTPILVVTAWLLLVPFLLPLSKCLKEVAPDNRTIEPGQLWLNLIPVFNVVWWFISVSRFSESVRNEARSRRVQASDPVAWGIASAALFVAFELTVFWPLLNGFLFAGWVLVMALYLKAVVKLMMVFLSANSPPDR